MKAPSISIPWLLALAVLPACGDGLPPPAEVKALPDPPLSKDPSAARPAPEDTLPEEGAAGSLVRFLRALEKGDGPAAATYLDPRGGDQVRALREELLRGDAKSLERIRAYFPEPGDFRPEARLLEEDRVSFLLPMGPGGRRRLRAFFRRDRRGVWLLRLLQPQ